MSLSLPKCAYSDVLDCDFHMKPCWLFRDDVPVDAR